MTTVLSGRDGSLSFEGRRIGKVKSWQLQRSRERLDNTTLDSWDESWVPGKRAGAATATILYDSSETDTADLLNNILINKPPKSLLGLYLRTPDVGFDVPAYIESISPSVAVGSASAVEVKFKIPAAGVRLIISGPSTVYINDIRSFRAEVAGVEGVWSFYWEATSTPVIATPNDQTTNITFPSLGVARIQVTATLGTLVLTDYIDVTVADYPLFWVSSSEESSYSIPGSDCAAQAVADNGDVFYGLPFTSPSDDSKRFAILKYNSTGTLLWIKRVDTAQAGGWTWPGGFGLQSFGYGMGVIPMNDGGATFMVPLGSIINVIRVDSSGALVYAKANTINFYNWITNSLYVPTHNAIYTGSYRGSTLTEQGAARAYNATTGELISVIDDLTPTFGVGTQYRSANWPRSIAYNPLNDTVVMTTRHNTLPDGFDIHEAPAFFREGGSPTGNIAVNSYRINNSTAMSGSSAGGRGLAINANGEMYTSWNDGILILDSTFNCIKAVNRNSNLGAPEGATSGIFYQEAGAAILPSGEYVAMQIGPGGNGDRQASWEIYSPDLTTRQGVLVTSDNTSSTGGWNYRIQPGGVRMKSVNALTQTCAFHLGRGIVGARLFMPPGNYLLNSAQGSNKRVRANSYAPNSTINVTDLMTTSIRSYSNTDPVETTTDIASLITIGDEPEIDVWALASFAAL